MRIAWEYGFLLFRFICFWMQAFGDAKQVCIQAPIGVHLYNLQIWQHRKYCLPLDLMHVIHVLFFIALLSRFMINSKH